MNEQMEVIGDALRFFGGQVDDGVFGLHSRIEAMAVEHLRCAQAELDVIRDFQAEVGRLSDEAEYFRHEYNTTESKRGDLQAENARLLLRITFLEDLIDRITTPVVDLSTDTGQALTGEQNDD